MWTSFVHQTIHTGDTPDYVFVEANEPCSKMFLKHVYPDCFGDYIIHHRERKPSIENVTEYTGVNELVYRVICLDELKELGLVSKCEHEVNLLFYPEHKNTCTNPF